MDTFISHSSALEYWRWLSAEESYATVKVRNTKLQGRPPVARSLRTGILSELSQPLHVLVGSGKERRKIDGLHCHVWTGQVPENSFYQIAPGLLVCSPEFLFLLMAKTVSLIRLIVLGFELCGTYRLGEAKDPSQGMREAKPLTSTVKLAAYLAKAGASPGIKNALQALKYVGDGSASPMETVLTMMLSLPPRFGGHGLPMPVLNHHFELPAELREVAGVSGFRCDLAWLPQMIGLEYNSDIYHTAPDRIAWDALRSNILTGMGITLFTVTKQQVTDPAQLQCLAEDLAKLIGRRLRHNEPEFSRRHTELRSQLLRKQSRG